MDEQESDFEVMQLLETEPVFQIQNVLVRICGSVSRFVVASTDPALFVSELQDATKNILSIFAYCFLEVHLHHSYKIKSHKETTKD